MTRTIALAVTALALLCGPSAEAQLRASAYRVPAATSARAIRLTAPVRSRYVPRTPRVAPSASRQPTAPTSTGRTPDVAPQPGTLSCLATDNGAPTLASFSARSSSGATVGGTCGSAVTLAAGSWTVRVTLDSALDRPTLTYPIQVAEGAHALVRAEFATAIFEARFTEGGNASYGRAVLTRDGVEVGSVGSGVPVRVSPGTYTVEAHHRTEVRTYTVILTAGQRRALSARF